MYTSIEIEFKTKISEEQYNEFIKIFNLENKVFSQINYYFDTENHDLINNHIVLRIREKDYNIKLTSKTKAEVGTLEKHIILEKDKAYEMIANGFNANIIDINYNVTNIAKLTTYRAKASYKSGTLFFDKNVYFDTVDYEIEFEANNFEEGQKEFLEFLEENQIQFIKMESKSKRAYKKSSQ